METQTTTEEWTGKRRLSGQRKDRHSISGQIDLTDMWKDSRVEVPLLTGTRSSLTSTNAKPISSFYWIAATVHRLRGLASGKILENVSYLQHAR